MLQHLTSPQLTELEAFWHLEGGWGEYKEDYRNAQLLSMHANINRDKKRKSEPYKPDDFVMRPKFVNDESEEQNEEKVRSSLDMLASSKNKKNTKPKE